MFEQSDSSASNEHHRNASFNDSGYFPDLAFNDKLNLDSSVHEAQDKMNQQIVQSELDEEKHKTQDLVQRISQLIRFY